MQRLHERLVCVSSWGQLVSELQSNTCLVFTFRGFDQLKLLQSSVYIIF